MTPGRQKIDDIHEKFFINHADFVKKVNFQSLHEIGTTTKFFMTLRRQKIDDINENFFFA